MYGYDLRNEEKSGHNVENNWGDENQGGAKAWPLHVHT